MPKNIRGQARRIRKKIFRRVSIDSVHPVFTDTGCPHVNNIHTESKPNVPKCPNNRTLRKSVTKKYVPFLIQVPIVRSPCQRYSYPDGTAF